MDDKSIGTSPLVIKPQFSPLQELGLALDQDGGLDENIVCRKCDYNLRGLTLDRNCPECETAIEQTLNRSTLRFSDQAWLKRVRSGLTLMLLYIFGLILMNILVMVAVFVFGIGFSTDSIDLEVGINIFLVVLLSLQIIAILRLTTVESCAQSNNTKISSRKLARIALVASIIAGAIAMITDSNRIVMFFPSVVEMPWLTQVSWWIGQTGSLLGLIGMFALFVYGRSLSQRFPADSLAKNTRFVMWGLMIPTIAFSIWYIFVELSLDNHPIDFSSMSMTLIAQVVIGVSALAFGIWGIVLLFQYRSQFTKAMKLAA